MSAITIASLKQAVGGPTGVKATLVATLMRSRTQRAYLVDGSSLTFPIPIRQVLPDTGTETTVDFGDFEQPENTYWKMEIIAGHTSGDVVFRMNFVFPEEDSGNEGVFDLDELIEVDPDNYQPVSPSDLPTLQSLVNEAAGYAAAAQEAARPTWWVGTQAEYDGLGEYDENTLYLVVPED